MAKSPKETSEKKAKDGVREIPESIGTALEALTEITSKDATRSFIVPGSVSAKDNDRGAAILVSTVLEDLLERAIISWMRLSKSRQREFFGSSSFFSIFTPKSFWRTDLVFLALKLAIT